MGAVAVVLAAFFAVVVAGERRLGGSPLVMCSFSWVVGAFATGQGLVASRIDEVGIGVRARTLSMARVQRFWCAVLGIKASVGGPWLAVAEAALVIEATVWFSFFGWFSWVVAF